MQLADPFYYLVNFQTLIDTLSVRDADLLDAEERAFIASFARLPMPARALLVRMVMRKGSLFRSSTLQYPEIPEPAAAVLPLREEDCVDASPLLTLEELFRLLTKPELIEHLALERKIAALPKPAMLEALREAAAAAKPFPEWCRASRDTVYRLTVDPVCERLRLMFFGNFRQTFSEFVMADLGVVRYEKTAQHPGARPFATRGQVDAFHALFRCREKFHAGANPEDIERELPPPILDCEWLEERRERLRFEIARAHERAGNAVQALAIYAGCAHPQAGARAERLWARAAGVKQRRPARMTANAPELQLSFAGPDATASVERQVRDHLMSGVGEGSSVFFVENALVNSLFGLLCWPAVFAPVPGAFFHAFHHGPADLSSTGFLTRRATWFAECLAQLRDGSYKAAIRRTFKDKYGVASPFVAWGLIEAPLLELALECLPATHLECLFEWLLRDLRANRTGFPDLVQFWPGSRRYRLIEVKGPGDRLQPNQRRILDHCLTHRIPVSVCHVRWHGRAVQLGEGGREVGSGSPAS